MRASVVIPVWNGASVVCDCLEALYAHSSDELLEVICVDNASCDESASLIADRYPSVRLIREPVNLGFAGGVNAGVDVAQGDVLILLNQDCMVQSGWLTALTQVFEAHPQFGIAGCTIFNPDGTLNHAGAIIRHPDARSVHLADVEGSQPRSVEYVTGTAFAMRRQTWQVVGRFDEGYYPAYYEESDYCYRARRKGIGTAYVPESRVTHLSSSREWQLDSVRHSANQHRARYRFVIKHFDSHEVAAFFEAEYGTLEAERYFDQVVGRLVAARDTLRGLADIIERRRIDLGEGVSPIQRRQLEVGFTQILRRSFPIAEQLAPYRAVECPSESTEEESVAAQRLQALQQREYDLLARIYFREPSDDRSEPFLRRLFRLLVLRPLSFLIGRDYLLLAELNTVHVARMDQMDRRMSQVDRRVNLLETLADYDYR